MKSKSYIHCLLRLALGGALALPCVPSARGADQAILGSWFSGDASQSDNSAQLTFFNNGYYLFVQDGPASQDGIQRGTYTWDSTTGQLTTGVIVNTMGGQGFSNTTIPLSISGNNLTINGATNFSRVTTGSSPIVGSWFAGDASLVNASVEVTLFSSGYYLLLTDQDSSPSGDPSGHDGMERGTYTWNSATGAFSASALVDTNGGWGLSNPAGAETVTVSGNTLIYSVVNDETLAFTSVNSVIPEPATYAAFFSLGVLGFAMWRRRC